MNPINPINPINPFKAFKPRRSVILNLILSAVLAGCAIEPRVTSSAHDELVASLEKSDSARLGATSSPAPVVPPVQVPERPAQVDSGLFDLKVNDAAAADVLNSIVNDTPYSMVVHPEVKGRVSLTLKRVSVTDVLNSMREIYGYDYRIDGRLIYVFPAGFQTRVFTVNYLASQRTGVSDIRVSSNALSDSSTSSGGNATGGGAGSVTPSSTLQTLSNHNFWAELRGVLGELLGCRSAQVGAGVPGGVGGGRRRGARRGCSREQQ